MTKQAFYQYLGETVRLREREAVEYPLMYFLREAIRIASVMALVLAFASVITPDTFDWSAAARLRFICFFGVAMGASNLALARWRQRATKTT